MSAAGERHGSRKVVQVVRKGVEPQRRLHLVRQALFRRWFDDERKAVRPPQKRSAARPEGEYAGVLRQGGGGRRKAECGAEQRPAHPCGRKTARSGLFYRV